MSRRSLGKSSSQNVPSRTGNYSEATRKSRVSRLKAGGGPRRLTLISPDPPGAGEQALLH